MLLILIPYGWRRFGAIRFRNIGRANSLVGWSPAYYDGGAETVQARGRTTNTVGAAGTSAAAYIYVRLYPYTCTVYIYICIYICIYVCVCVYNVYVRVKSAFDRAAK